jgi:hypothetical protein
MQPLGVEAKPQPPRNAHCYASVALPSLLGSGSLLFADILGVSRLAPE